MAKVNGRHYTYSFSGSDANVYAYFPQNPSVIVPLDTLHTVSISVYEAKGPARALGNRGVTGFARAVRTIGGSLIATVIEDHPLRNLMEVYDENYRAGWSLDQDKRGVGQAIGDRYRYDNCLATLLPPFNLLIEYVSEMADWDVPTAGSSSLVDVSGASLLVEGVEFLNEGIVTSTNDIVSETTFSWTARDYKQLSSLQLEQGTGFLGARESIPWTNERQYRAARMMEDELKIGTILNLMMTSSTLPESYEKFNLPESEPAGRVYGPVQGGI